MIRDPLDPSIIDLVRRLVPLLIEGDHATHVTLRAQWAKATVREIGFTNSGFWAQFDVPADVARTLPKNMTGGSARILVEGVAEPAGCALVVRDGVITSLDVHIFGEEEWPETTVVREILHASPLLVPKAAR